MKNPKTENHKAEKQAEQAETGRAQNGQSISPNFLVQSDKAELDND
jgi:hypothetical protein